MSTVCPSTDPFPVEQGVLHRIAGDADYPSDEDEYEYRAHQRGDDAGDPVICLLFGAVFLFLVLDLVHGAPPGVIQSA
jgi:hypothetical protein